MNDADRAIIERAMREGKEVVVVTPLAMPTDIIVELLGCFDRLHRLYGGGGYVIKSQNDMMVNGLRYLQIVLAPEVPARRWWQWRVPKVTVRMRA